MIRQYQDRITPTPILLLTECLHLEQDLFDIFLENDAIVVLQPLLTRLEEPVVCQTIRFYSEVSTLHNYPPRSHPVRRDDSHVFDSRESLLSDRVLEEIVLLIVNITCASDDQIEAFGKRRAIVGLRSRTMCVHLNPLSWSLPPQRFECSSVSGWDRKPFVLWVAEGPCLPAPLSAAEQSVPSHNFQSFISSGKSSINVFPQFVIQAGGQDRILS
ncbi:hypothetical protein BLNAU_23825 [Blattamonas nauphoetae]|uniref:Uncharacterized protein n=1 Tax=Blattamonas nauphoetae TaxID=2049346 RepID=A0ABQ9WP48_9EUKA|nr:hypothetical protein BLNAU_23825 [Blattamonas nauphoetae]